VLRLPLAKVRIIPPIDALYCLLTLFSTASASSSTGSSSKGKAVHNPRFTFGGDAEDSEDEEEANQNGTKTAKGEDDEEEEDDDLSLAFSILELARVGYEKVLENGEAAKLTTLEGEEWSTVMIKSQLAEVLNDLADVGLESGK
jgi:HAT1-interacting factor 1